MRKIIGPGVIISAVGIGTGEYLLYPFITSRVGLTFLWAAAIGLAFQYLSLLHTEIHPEWEGLGLAGILVSGALDDIRSRERTVDPVCTYVVGYVEKHPEYDNLVARSGPGRSYPRNRHRL